MDNDEWLTVGKATERLRAAGYPDSVDTVRRAIDAGTYGPRGQAWYKTPAGYRYVKTSAVDAEVARRKQGSES